MRRELIKQLLTWKQDKRRKPLILYGVRQVGKTWLMRSFGAEQYQNTVYINFDHNPRMRRLFEQDLDTARILRNLEIEAGAAIMPGETLIIFDEIQECPAALTSLKYFCEAAPQYHLIAAGSLLGVAQHEGTGFPVGKVDILTLYPLSFQEFLAAVGEERLLGLIESGDFASVSVFADKFIERLKQYFYIGGMPEAVAAYQEDGDLAKVRRIQETLLHAWYGDFSKHIPAREIAKVRLIWDSIPDQLGRENKRFLYSFMKEGSKSRDYEIALEWLKDSGLVHQIKRVSRPNMPLAAYQEHKIFKLYCPDIGLLAAQTALDIKAFIEPDERIFNHFCGALTEQFVLQELRAAFGPSLPVYYWANEKNTAEIDFVVQLEDMIIPIEVKSGENVRAKSLKSYMETFKPPVAVRTSLRDFSSGGNLYDIPLWMIKDALKNIPCRLTSPTKPKAVRHTNPAQT